MPSFFQENEIDAIIDMSLEDLAYEVLTRARANLWNGTFQRGFLFSQAATHDMPSTNYQKRNEAERAVQEAIAWLESEILIAPELGTNGQNDHLFITRRGEKVCDRDRFQSYQAAAKFPKSLLHPKIAIEVWSDLARGDLSTAVFRAFKTVEEAVREATNSAFEDIGVNLMRKAFGKNGQFTDKSLPKAEQDGLENLFVGAIGSYKNSHSHRTVTIKGLQEAQEIVMLASHLLRIVDDRRTRVNK